MNKSFREVWEIIVVSVKLRTRKRRAPVESKMSQAANLKKGINRISSCRLKTLPKKDMVVNKVRGKVTDLMILAFQATRNVSKRNTAQKSRLVTRMQHQLAHSRQRTTILESLRVSKICLHIPCMRSLGLEETITIVTIAPKVERNKSTRS